MKKTIELIKISVISTLLFTAVLCIIYPLAVFAMGQLLFPHKANGSLITRKGDPTIIGSVLIGENFQATHYFHPRPSFAGPEGYDAIHSGASNFGPTSHKLNSALHARTSAYRQTNNLPSTTQLPVDAATSSASGLDPHISIANVMLQLPRVAKARNISEEKLHALVIEHIERPTWGFLGEARINVLLLNIALDESYGGIP
ncbi:MAG: K(+)-transporting ATPase subunit C [Rhabdochlamydiaceae bacterium]|jgi:K+-transporting ATPase ATPase C chain